MRVEGAAPIRDRIEIEFHAFEKGKTTDKKCWRLERATNHDAGIK